MSGTHTEDGTEPRAGTPAGDEVAREDAAACDPAAGGGAVSVARVDVDELARLEEERRFLLRSLDDLEREKSAGDLDEADYTALRDDYTRRAAEVLRAIQSGTEALPPPAPRRLGRTLAIVGAVLAVGILAGILIANAAGQRAPGQSLSGDPIATSGALLPQCRGLLDQAQILDAVKCYDSVLKVAPANPEALTYRGWALVLTRDADLVGRGRAFIEQAIQADPKYPDAHCVLGMALGVQGDRPGALQAITDCLALDPSPDLAAGAKAVADQLRQELGAATTTQGSSVPAAPATTAAAPSTTGG